MAAAIARGTSDACTLSWPLSRERLPCAKRSNLRTIPSLDTELSSVAGGSRVAVWRGAARMAGGAFDIGPDKAKTFTKP